MPCNLFVCFLSDSTAGNHAPDLDGNLERIEETIPRITTIASNLTHGKYTVECRKLDDKHVCIAGVKVYSNVIL